VPPEILMCRCDVSLSIETFPFLKRSNNLDYQNAKRCYPEEFIPERFLVDEGHQLYPNPAAFRPFEQGPRNCIGQTLVYNEIGTVLIMTARIFDISPVYDE